MGGRKHIFKGVLCYLLQQQQREYRPKYTSKWHRWFFNWFQV